MKHVYFVLMSYWPSVAATRKRHNAFNTSWRHIRPTAAANCWITHHHHTCSGGCFSSWHQSQTHTPCLTCPGEWYIHTKPCCTAALTDPGFDICPRANNTEEERVRQEERRKAEKGRSLEWVLFAQQPGGKMQWRIEWNWGIWINVTSGSQHASWTWKCLRIVQKCQYIVPSMTEGSQSVGGEKPGEMQHQAAESWRAPHKTVWEWDATFSPWATQARWHWQKRLALLTVFTTQALLLLSMSHCTRVHPCAAGHVLRRNKPGCSLLLRTWRVYDVRGGTMWQNISVPKANSVFFAVTYKSASTGYMLLSDWTDWLLYLSRLDAHSLLTGIQLTFSLYAPRHLATSPYLPRSPSIQPHHFLATRVECVKSSPAGCRGILFFLKNIYIFFFNSF